MAHWHEFTDENDEKVYIDLEKVEAIMQDGGRTELAFVSGETVIIMEKYQDVKRIAGFGP